MALLEPTDPTTGEGARAALAEIREACPSLAEWDDATVLATCAHVAQYAYSGARESLWAWGRALEIPRNEWDTVLRVSLTVLYPVAIVTGSAAEIAS